LRGWRSRLGRGLGLRGGSVSLMVWMGGVRLRRDREGRYRLSPGVESMAWRGRPLLWRDGHLLIIVAVVS
jgi:hypothetical protein